MDVIHIAEYHGTCLKCLHPVALYDMMGEILEWDKAEARMMVRLFNPIHCIYCFDFMEYLNIYEVKNNRDLGRNTPIWMMEKLRKLGLMPET